MNVVKTGDTGRAAHKNSLPENNFLDLLFPSFVFFFPSFFCKTENIFPPCSLHMSIKMLVPMSPLVKYIHSCTISFACEFMKK